MDPCTCLLRYQSQNDNRYKTGLIKTMLHRAKSCHHRLSYLIKEECDRLLLVFVWLKYIVR